MSYNYKGISNNPTERDKVIYPFCWLDGAFTTEELDKICDYFSKQELQDAKTIDDNSDNPNKIIPKNIEPRKSMIYFQEYSKDTSWFFEKLNYSIDTLNTTYFNFDLNGYGYVQYTEYYSNINGKYDFHMDTVLGPNAIQIKNESQHRKLSIIMLLNEPGKDFEGGDFEFNTGEECDALKIELQRGRIIVFPSFVIHRVRPVTKGTRKSLVAWILGPKFK